MKDGLRVYDADTHVNPAAEVLERYVDPSFRARLSELAPYRQASGEGRHHYGFGRKFYRRVLGEAAPRESFTGRESQWRGGKLPRPGVQDDQAENRVKDMDDEGTDVHFLIPSSFMSLVGLDDPVFEVGMARAYHRHMADFCGEFPTRLKGLIVASTRNVGEGCAKSANGGIPNGRWRSSRYCPRTCRPTIPIWIRSGALPRSTICRSRTTARPGTRRIIPATRTSGTTSFSVAWPPIPGVRCGLSHPSSAAGS